MSDSLAMHERHRLFVALVVPESLRAHAVAAAASAVAHTADPRLVPASNLHVTLQFIGRIAPEAMGELHAALAEAFHGPVVRLRAGEIVPRPSPGRARLLALELDDVDGALTVLAKRVHRATGSVLGARDAEHPVRPHITLARFRRPERMRRSPSTRSERVFDITRVALYDSDIAPGRSPRYDELLGSDLGTLAQRSPSNG